MTDNDASAPRSLYLAGRWSRREEIERYAVHLRGIGVEVTSRWLTDPMHRITEPEGEGALAFNSELAMHDWEDVHRADALVYFSPGGQRGGCHVEFGIALALRRRVFLVGDREHVFTWMESVERFPDFPSLFERVFLPAFGGVAR